ncbi:hypothetical protein MIR68_009341 [Amoeboaphelidium protococcarum]|nr:hypothetical protein MIR68_009341 [Amoeboaphelidium protococcarum]
MFQDAMIYEQIHDESQSSSLSEERINKHLSKKMTDSIKKLSEQYADKTQKSLSQLKDALQSLANEEVLDLLDFRSWDTRLQMPSVFAQILNASQTLSQCRREQNALQHQVAQHEQKIAEITEIARQTQQRRVESQDTMKNLLKLQVELRKIAQDAKAILKQSRALCEQLNSRDGIDRVLKLSQQLQYSKPPLNWSQNESLEFIGRHQLPAVQEHQIRSSLLFKVMNNLDQYSADLTRHQEQFNQDGNQVSEGTNGVDAGEHGGQHVFFRNSSSHDDENQDMKMLLDF